MALEDLDDKQRLFLEFYLGDARLNATRAARMADYAFPSVAGARLLANVNVRTAINERISQVAMAADEVLERLAMHARSSPDDVLDDEGVFSIQKARETGAIDLVREYSCEEVLEPGQGDEAPVRLVRKHKVKMSDPLGYLTLLGKGHRLWSDRADITHHFDKMTTDELIDLISGEVAGAAETQAPGAGGTETKGR